MRSQSAEREEKYKYASARGRAEQKQRESSFSSNYLKIPEGVKFFKPKVGVMLIDIVAYRVGEGNPCADEGMLHYERTYHLHARIGPDSVPYLCARLTADKPCIICQHRARLLKTAAEESEDVIKDLAPKERQLFWVRNLKDPDAGWMIWDTSYHLFGKQLDARIRNSDEEEGWDRFAALKGGMTLKIGFKEKSFGGRTFLEAETIDFKEREDLGSKLLEKLGCLDEMLLLPDYDKLKKVFLEADDEDEDEEAPKSKKSDEDDEEDEKPAKKKPVVEDDDEDEDEPPKKSKKASDDDDDDEDEADQEEAKDDDDDDDEDEKPAKKSKKPSDDDDEDEDEKPAKKSKDDDDDDDAEADQVPAWQRQSESRVGRRRGRGRNSQVQKVQGR
jgi:hypothetical protein